MQITIAKELPFVPTWNGNKNLPKDEQIEVIYRDLSVVERNAIVGYKERDGQEEIPYTKRKFDADIDFDTLLLKSVLELKRCSWKKGNEVHEIKTGKDLCDAPGQFGDLFSEITGMLTKRLNHAGKNAKNSE